MTIGSKNWHTTDS